MKEFSVLLSIYKNTKIAELIECFDSLFNQTVKASEYVTVIDGPIPDDLNQAILDLTAEHSEIKLVRLERNYGLGVALNEGLKHCSYEIVARMDTDDVCVNNRFERQLATLEADSELSLVGSNIIEFTGTINNPFAVRQVPETHEEICKFLKKRNPFNHMTVMFRKSEILRAGSYQHSHYTEDFYLWIRMYLAGCKFYNLQENLVYARIDTDTYRRRGGYKYYKSLKSIFKLMRKNKMISWFSYQHSKAMRFIGYVLLPNGMRGAMFKKMMRKKYVNKPKTEVAQKVIDVTPRNFNEVENFSVLLSAYKNTKPSEFIESFDSLFNQTVRANEYVLVIDGEISAELNDAIRDVCDNNENVKVVQLPYNMGLGFALKEGLKYCTNELVARMDTDDVCAPQRFERQLSVMKNNPSLSMVGANITEFIETADKPISVRQVPETHEEICKFLQKRSAFNHISVMFRKSEVERAGGYRHSHFSEDYYLWVRMWKAGCSFYNIQENLAHARVDKSTYQRRGGIKYYKAIKEVLKYMRYYKMISAGTYFRAKMARFIGYVIVPTWLRGWLFRKTMRKKVKQSEK